MMRWRSLSNVVLALPSTGWVSEDCVHHSGTADRGSLFKIYEESELFTFMRGATIAWVLEPCAFLQSYTKCFEKMEVMIFNTVQYPMCRAKLSRIAILRARRFALQNPFLSTGHVEAGLEQPVHGKFRASAFFELHVLRGLAFIWE